MMLHNNLPCITQKIDYIPKSLLMPYNVFAFHVCQYNLHFKTLYPGTIDVSILMRNKSPSTDEI